MLLEETPSGNLRLVSPAKPEAAVRLTRGDVNNMVEVFELLDRWAREVRPDGSDHDA
ncbi:MAG: hypothetical protein HYS27_23270 [Deltaproteobacteria bacterium]|nr:hypothetical protein [Deltaproteobacteria bacterium]